jgi:modified peptide precursor CbpA
LERGQGPLKQKKPLAPPQESHYTKLSPGGREFAGLAGKSPEEGGPNMAKESSCKKPISIRYTCAPNGDQVGLSHYLMADAKKAK